MSPHHIDPNVDYRKLHELSEQFTEHWKRLHAFYFDAVAHAVVRSLQAFQSSITGIKPCV